MRTTLMAGCMLWLSLAFQCRATASTNLLPGLAYRYDSPQKLNGKLAFLLDRRHDGMTNSDTAGSIYEFDLAQKTLRKLCDAPGGQLYSSPDGNTFCVIYHKGVYFQDRVTNAFVY